MKGSKISITNQYPKSLVEKKKSLIPLLKQARDADVKSVFIRDKLFIGGVAYGSGSMQVAIENAKKQKKKSSALSNNENDVNKFSGKFR